ncbi:mechanosensitive ion channel family protein [Baaleninema sp.]|uniref:mechanosensitive ion channel family protein n=1 Tax=Baaleninema sp. TaxID=3101197 RepID=UPI003D01AB4E
MSHPPSIARWFSRRIVRFVLIACLALVSVTAIVPSTTTSVFAQTPLPIPVPTQSPLESAPVRLNGLPIFEVASKRPGEIGDSSIPPIEKRVSEIESVLNNILEEGFDPETLRVYTQTLNNQPIILVSDEANLSPQVVMTVTELDAELTETPVESLAENWKEKIREALIEARQERQPKAQRRRVRTALTIAAIVAVLTPILWVLQRRLKDRYRELSSQRHSEELPSPEEEREAASSRSPSRSIQFLNALIPQIALERRISLVVLLRRVLQWLQVTLLLGGAIGILFQFPQTRVQALWLSDVPLQILGIWLVVSIANKATDLAIDGFLQSWVERQSIDPSASQRFVLRAPTLAAALKGMTSFIAGFIGVIWFLALQKAPLDSLLAGAGIFGVALTLVFQNLIKDLINGILILWEDQFAVGDVIDVGYGAGFVEYMNLRITRIRGEGGRLSTIPNSQINVVHNLTKEWSRIDFRIRVTPDTDAMQAMQVMKDTISKMQADPDWSERIIDPTMLVGVERVDETGIGLLMWIKTKPIEQWNVEREYRRRLKLAFDEAGIRIGIPQQTIALHNGSMMG